MNVYRFLRLAFWVLTALASGLLAASASSAQGISGRFSSLLDQVSIARGAEEIAPESSAFGCGSGGATARATQSAADYVLFEGGAVRPLALSPDGSKLAVANTPANCLEIYQVSDQQLQLESSVMVGVEPVAVAFNGSDEVWVVNHLSDSVSVVSLTATPRVIATLQVGDEPRDIVFAGENHSRAFISAAFRGQNHPFFTIDDLYRAGTGRADVWVFDATTAAEKSRDSLIGIVNLFSDSPRALAVSADGSEVYAAAFMSGNKSTVLRADIVLGAKPAPTQNHEGEAAPETGMIVRKVASQWTDADGSDWSAAVNLDLPDKDVFVIDALAAIPAVTQSISGVGTILFNMVVNPVTDQIYVSNLNALNHIRFEGSGETSTTVRGRIAESQISVIENSAVVGNHLNPHVDFDVPEHHVYPAEVTALSASQPTSLAISPDGKTLYVAAFGSNKVVKMPVDALHNGKYDPADSVHLHTPGGGPTGLVLSSDGTRMVVYDRFNHVISLWDTEEDKLLVEQALFTPEPNEIIQGRRFLYDASLTSANGTSACSSCHVFGDMDQLAWNLGNPDGDLQTNLNPYVANSPRTTPFFHPMKGPMATQTLRGIADSGPQHWRGDRMGQNRETVDGELESLEAAAFKEFNPAFVELLGRAEQLSSVQMQAFTDFALALTPPPNPIRQLDNSLTADQQLGRDIYFQVGDITGLGSCNHCHTLNPGEKQFGTGGLMTFEGAGVAENFKVPHFRNAYAKVGMFGTSGSRNRDGFTGDQIKGFGYLHDGSVASLLDFFAADAFNFPEPKDVNVSHVVDFVMAADSNMAPVVGQQVTLSASDNAALERLNLLETRASVTAPLPECDLIARGVVNGLRFSAMMTEGGEYLSSHGARYSTNQLRTAVAEGGVLTFTCTPPGSGQRLALDR